MANMGLMEALDFINNKYSMSRGPVKQQPQFGSEMERSNSNNNNIINVKHFGDGGHGHSMLQPMYSSSPIAGQKWDNSGFEVGRNGSLGSICDLPHQFITHLLFL